MNKPGPVAAEGQAGDRAPDVPEREDRLAGADVPQQDGPVAGTGQARPVGAETDEGDHAGRA